MNSIFLKYGLSIILISYSFVLIESHFEIIWGDSYSAQYIKSDLTLLIV